MEKQTVIRAGVAVLLVLACAQLVVPVVADSDDEIYGVSPGEAIVLFGNGPPDSGVFFDDESFEQIDDESDDIDASDAESLLDSTTVEWETPPETPSIWNENNFQIEVDSERPRDESVSPEGVETTDSGHIKYAFVTIYDVSPATVAHIGDDTRTYIRPDGNVKGQVDFVVEEPDRITDTDSAEDFVSENNELSAPDLEQIVADDQGVNIGNVTSVDADVDVSFDVESGDVTRYELLVDGGVEDEADTVTSDSDTHVSTGTFEYEGLEDDPLLRIEADIESTVEATVSYEYEAEIADGNVTRDRDGTHTERGTFTDDTTVTDEMETTVERLEDTEVELFELPDGETVTIVDAPHAFSTFEIGGEVEEGGFWDRVFNRTDQTPPDEVQTGWVQFTTRDDRWDRQVVATDDGETTTRNSTAMPIQTRTAVASEPLINETDDDVAFPKSVEVLNNQTYSAPEIPDNTSILTQNHTMQTELRTEHRRDMADEDMDIYGLVSPDPVTIPAEEINEEPVDEANVSVNVTEFNMSRDRPTEVEITLRNNETGEYISHDEAGGAVLLSDHGEPQEVDLGSDGTAVTRTNQSGSIEVRYSPPPWTEADKPLTGDTDYDQADVLPDQDSVTGWIVEIFVRLVPVLVVWYMINAARKMFKYGGGNQVN